jgi:hypothetical protein
MSSNSVVSKAVSKDQEMGYDYDGINNNDDKIERHKEFFFSCKNSCPRKDFLVSKLRRASRKEQESS